MSVEALQHMASRAGIPNKSRTEAAELARKHGQACFDALASIAGIGGQVGADVVDHLEKSGIPTAGERIQAIKLLLAYGFGKPPERVEHTGLDGEQQVIRHEVVFVEASDGGGKD